jgi:hypothetical protein
VPRVIRNPVEEAHVRLARAAREAAPNSNWSQP